FGHVGASAAGTADLFRDGADDLAGLNARGQVFGHAADERNLLLAIDLGDRAEDDDTRTELIAQVVNEGAHLAAVDVVDALRDDLDAVHVADLFGRRGDACGGGLHAQLFEFLAELLQFLVAVNQLALELVSSFGTTEFFERFLAGDRLD